MDEIDRGRGRPGQGATITVADHGIGQLAQVGQPVLRRLVNLVGVRVHGRDDLFGITPGSRPDFTDPLAAVVQARQLKHRLDRVGGRARLGICPVDVGAERQSGSQRKTALTQLASQLNAAAATARDQAKVRTLSTAVTDLANAQR